MQRTFFFILLSFILLYSCSAQWSKRDARQQPERIMDSIGVKQGMVIGEVGAGEGYFTFKLSARVGSEGKIYANDISKKSLKSLKKRSEEEGINNISLVYGEVEDPLFPGKNLDMIIMVMVFHDLEEPVIFFKNLKKYLKPGAPVVIVDRDPDKWGDDRGHFLKKEKILSLMSDAGYKLFHLYTFLAADNIFIYHPL